MATTVKRKMKSKTKIKALSDKPAFRFYPCYSRSRRKPYYLQVRFGGEYVRLFYHKTEEIACRVAAFALEHAPRFESSDDLEGFRLFISAWLVEQGYSKKQSIRNTKGFWIYRDKWKPKKPFVLNFKFCGKSLSYPNLGHFETEEIAGRVAAFALEHAPRFESSDDLKGFKLLIRAWAIKQGYTSYVPFGVYALPLELRPAIEALIELQNTIALKELQKLQDTISLKENDTLKVPKGVWTLKEIETLRRLTMTHTDAQLSPILNRSIGAIGKQRKKLNIPKSRNLSHLFEAMETLKKGE